MLSWGTILVQKDNRNDVKSDINLLIDGRSNLFEVFLSLGGAVEDAVAVVGDGGAAVGDAAAPVASPLQRLAPGVELPPPVVRHRISLSGGIKVDGRLNK